MQNILYFILAAIGLGFLIFIHELGHYYVARKVGMKVEAFAIGFGKAIYTWNRDGVAWKICWLPFGGYVKIAGMEKQGNLEPYEIPDGFFGKKPWQRIKVALAGPITNILFAFLIFVIIWFSGGRLKPFSEFTHLIGWVEPQTELFEKGMRPGDEIQYINDRPFEGFKDLLYAQLLDGKKIEISGMEIDYFSGKRTHFLFPLKEENQDRNTLIQPLFPASYLIYQAIPEKNSLWSASPMENSGIQPGDRIISVDNEIIFSLAQLSEIVNEPRSFLTIRRGDKTLLSRVPRIAVKDLRLSPVEKAEIDDWKSIVNLPGKVEQLYFIPYALSNDGVVESALSYITERSEERVHQIGDRSGSELELMPNDKIIAVDGIAVHSSTEILQGLQERKLQVIVLREPAHSPVKSTFGDRDFILGIDALSLEKMLMSIGTQSPISQLDRLHLLRPVIPQPMEKLTSDKKNFEFLLDKERQRIESMKNPQEKAQALKNLELFQKKLFLGISLKDREVVYNPNPVKLLFGVFEETWRTITALLTGYLNPKWMSGPVGIVQVMHHGWSLGIKEALFWMAIISCNSGILNLLPIPVLDGGHICFACYEAVTGKRIKAKTMEKLILPFVLLLIGLLLFVTYQDILRIFQRFFS